MVDLIWRKSSHSGSGDQCVEVAALPGGGRAIRDSKHPGLPSLTLSSVSFANFVQGVFLTN
ncbi:DUF397 domain-containing protein [Actinocorallia populi]|uniref:DUF397 domain-containing protein n=1 Tax=Actinocorallia populi TaxID=2079200 RepID=UPI000D08BFFC|nr:DUF397 domain-containing protein [Actinocorallia populi]